jgi:hypothetical protein
MAVKSLHQFFYYYSKYLNSISLSTPSQVGLLYQFCLDVSEAWFWSLDNAIEHFHHVANGGSHDRKNVFHLFLAQMQTCPDT